MEDKLNPSVVGAFVLMLGAALIAGVLWLSAGLNTKSQDLPYRSIVTESVAGLNLNAPVKYLGVDVGKVSSIVIDPGNSRQVLLGLLLHQGTPVKQDSLAVLKTQGLTGIAYVELSGGSLGSPPLLAAREGDVPLIPSKPSLSTRLENVLTNVLSNVDRLSSDISAVFDAPNRAALRQTLADTASTAHEIAAHQKAMGAAIDDAAHTLRRTAQASEQFGPTLARVQGAALALQSGGEQLSRAGNSTALAADAAASGVQQLRSSTLPELDQLLQQAGQLAESLQRLSDQTRERPGSLLLGGPARTPGPGEKAPP